MTSHIPPRFSHKADIRICQKQPWTKDQGPGQATPWMVSRPVIIGGGGEDEYYSSSPWWVLDHYDGPLLPFHCLANVKQW